MSNLPTRLSELLSENNLTVPALARLLNTDRSNINRFLRGERTPRFSYFVELLNFFDCSADYLLGLVDVPTDQPLHEVLPFGERLRTILKEQNLTQAEVMDTLSISPSVMYRWLSEKSKPSTDSLIRLANYFECSVDYLIGRVR